MTAVAVNRLKRVFRLPGAVKLRPPSVEEKASILPLKRLQPDSGDEEEVEVTGAREQPKKSRQAPPGAVADVAEERDLGKTQEKLADVEQRLAKADCDAADARGKPNFAIERHLDQNERYAKLEQDMSLVQDRVTAKEKKIEILQRESAAKQAEIKRLEGEVARLEAEGSRAAAAAKGAIDSAKAAMPVVQPRKEAPPTTSTAPPAASGPGVLSGSGESGEPPEGDSQRMPTQSEESRAGFLAAHTRADGTIETPSPTARGSDQTSRSHPPQATGGTVEGSGVDPTNPADPANPVNP
ncbi:translation initiation factor IF-2-like [Rosa chinensis]|uniref:translation initiation factor IF-2-like n=1 Tax=Rosa chinensis TaxID=74649 RepID=UPI000D08CFE8|nr:translation initiation factor IF-2-like [Rosa chinensis]